MAWEELSFCPRHPKVETRLSCGKCGTLICPRCLVYTPVGARCRECARVRRTPTFELGAATYLRAAAAGTLLAGVAGALWGLLLFPLLWKLPFLPWVVTLGIGYLIGEGTSVAVNRKRGRSLQLMAGACMVLSYLVAGLMTPLVFAITYPDPLFLLVLLIAVWVAADRVG